MKKIAIYGAGGLGREVLTIINAINSEKATWDFIGFFDDSAPNVLGGINELNSWREPLSLIIAIGNPSVKKGLETHIENDFIDYATLIHPRAILADDNIEVGKGSVVGAGAILTTNIEIGDHVLLNLNVTIGHDCQIGSFCSIMPGANISGQVTLDEAVLVGSGANILNGIMVGRKAKVGSGATVTKNVPSKITVVGVPAKPIQK
ncbi:acetyltransferase [Fulvivirga maritima]|uniref:acetyltransferase n=1 Tax=Fulvivirga maritima TaxID=2904247 RepID=UPI001F1C8E94|nr:acetyltransferase [Fulvivirga maritima]UII24852.1 acetyltransferase [Fulvivirga maritima]